MLRHIAILLRLLPRIAVLVPIALFTCEAQASEFLSSRELRELFPGRFQVLVHGAFFVNVTARPDGSLLAQFMDQGDSGRWSIRSGQLCIRLSKWLEGRTTCSKVTEEAGWYRSSDVVFRQATGFALADRTD
ncbi:MAG TPA: hypothetical protein VH933_10685 [Aestuariivirgaceae bacterium]|jgi:hypothetical protein